LARVSSQLCDAEGVKLLNSFQQPAVIEIL